MWSAKLIGVNKDLTKTIDSINVEVEFSDETTKTQKTYIFYLDELANVTLPTIKALIQADLDKLEKMDSLEANLASKIGVKL